MGEWQVDAHYKEFCTLGAKKYCYVDEKGNLHVTVSGLVKYRKINGEVVEISAKELEEIGGIDAFARAAFENIVFTKSGGTEAIYNTHPEITHINVGGHKLLITSNIYIKESTYTLGVTGDYLRFFTRAHTDALKIAEKMGTI